MTLSQPFERGQGGFDPALGSDDVADHLVTLFGRQLQGGQHFKVGAHGCQRGTQLVRGDSREVAGRLERGLGSLLLVSDAGQHSLDRLGDLHGLTHTADLDLVGAGLGIDRARLLSE